MTTSVRLILGLVFLVGCAGPLSAQIGAVGGVYVDPEGMLRDPTAAQPGGPTPFKDELKRRIEGTKPGAVSSSPLRKVSLRALEKAVADHRKQRGDLPLEMQYLAGLQSVSVVVIDPQQADVILAGPAEPWKVAPTGEAVGATSGHPVMRLEDLVTALRYVFGESESSFLGCSIDPTEQGLQGYTAYVQNLGAMNASRVAEVSRGMERAIGPQVVRVFGVPDDSRMALVLVAADYRLKRLSMGHDPAPVRKLPSYLDLAAKMTSGSHVQQHRFWFVGKYDAVRRSDDELAWAFEGPGVVVATAPSNASNEATAPRPTRAATAYVEAFTKQFPEIAKALPVFGELQNVVNLAAVAAVIHRSTRVESDEQLRWRPTHFLDEEACPQPRYSAPRQVPSLASVRLIRERSWMFSVSGGVEIQLADVVDPERVQPADEGLLAEQKAVVASRGTSWWWD